MYLKGVAASAGIGIGKVVVIKEFSLSYKGMKAESIEAEKGKFIAAREKFIEKTLELAEKLSYKVGSEKSEILKGQILMITDPFLTAKIDEEIEGGSIAEEAVDHACGEFIAMFSQLDDEMMKQRATDIGDIRVRMLKILLNVDDADLSWLEEKSIIVAKDFTPTMTVSIDKENVAGILTEIGGKTSHSAILANALEIPAVLGIFKLTENITDGETVIIDGEKGDVIINPTEKEIQEYKIKQKDFFKDKQTLQNYIGKETKSADGRIFQLYANIGSTEETVKLRAITAEGIGLFRSEVLFMNRNSLPTEEEQYEAYLTASEAMKGKEVIIRTLDIGGDKEISYFNIDKEENPFLGYRAIRFCLDNVDIFSIQLRALLRAGAKNGNIKIMLPFITSVDEIRYTKLLLEKAKKDLKDHGKDFDKNIKLGIMIETPAAVMVADILAKETDFFSIGTNDLTQYVMAVDRGNVKVLKNYSTYNPAVLRSIKTVIAAAKKEGIPVGMCGEAAADKLLIPLWMSFSLDEFSVSASSVLMTRKIISEITIEKADKIAEHCMTLSTADEVKDFLQSVLK